MPRDTDNFITPRTTVRPNPVNQEDTVISNPFEVLVLEIQIGIPGYSHEVQTRITDKESTSFVFPNG